MDVVILDGRAVAVIPVNRVWREDQRTARLERRGGIADQGDGVAKPGKTMVSAVI